MNRRDLLKTLSAASAALLLPAGIVRAVRPAAKQIDTYGSLWWRLNSIVVDVGRDYTRIIWWEPSDLPGFDGSQGFACITGRQATPTPISDAVERVRLLQQTAKRKAIIVDKTGCGQIAYEQIVANKAHFGDKTLIVPALRQEFDWVCGVRA